MNACKCECGWPVLNSSYRAVLVTCPQCGQMIACKAGRRPPLPLGDRVELLLDRFGGRQFKLAYRRLFGRDCGCDGRRRWLNTLSKKVRKAVARLLSDR